MNKDPDRPDWFAPAWRRFGFVALGLVWASVEWRMGNKFFCACAAVMTVHGIYEFFLSGKYRS